MPRAIWTGAISFGLVYIPVQLHSASSSSSLDLDFLDKRDFSPVGYQRINKRTGKAVEWANIVKGYQYQKGEYVALSDEDFRQANVKATQTIDIAQFTELASIPAQYYETPYYLSPGKGGAKVYALLREALKKSKKAAIATFVMRGRQHLALLHPNDKALVLNTLRFPEEIRAADDLELPPASEKAAGISPKELAMAERLIDEMTGEWDPSQFTDTYRKDLMARIKEKIKSHETHTLTPSEKTREPRQSAKVIDLMEVLKKSLEQGKGARRATSSSRASGSAAAPAKRARARKQTAARGRATQARRRRTA
jgi:DNA end-binding protein Ku